MAKRNKKQIILKYSEGLTLLYGDGPWTIRGVKRLKIKPTRVADGPSGLRKTGDNALSLDEKCVESIAYPCPALVASSFDADLMAEYGKMLGRECKANGVDVLLGPGINIKRNPLCGRNFEYYSEDPYLSGMLAASFTKGIQSVGVGACLKHFACNSQESYRMVNDSIVDMRALHEIYLRAFQIAIKESKPWMIMASYNKVNGTYACENRYLLKDTLKDKWKYDGVVVSDWGGVNDPVACHLNGLDVEMPCSVNRFPRLSAASRGHRRFISAAKDSADRVVRLSQRTHDERIKVQPFSLEDGHALAVKLAEKSIVMVKNNGVLPMKNLKNVAIIGQAAVTTRLGGGGSSKVSGHKVVSFLDYAKSVLGGEVHFAPGYDVNDEAAFTTLSIDALDLASRFESVIYFMGSTPKDETEGLDREDMRFDEKQLELFYRLVEICPNVIVVLCVGAPIESAFLEQASGVFLAYFPGEGGGEAIYNLITGAACPSGHLTESWPCRNYEVPSFGIYPGGQPQSLYRESIYVGYRYYLTAGQNVRYPFGFGLSYTEFGYTKYALSAKKLKLGETVTVSVTVTNKKRIAGDALVQIYVAPPENNLVYKAKRTLQGFQKIHLEGSEKQEVTIELSRRAFEHYDEESGEFLIEGGVYNIELGNSCTDILMSLPLEVEGDREFHSQIDRLAIYYSLPKDGFWQYDDAFERLLGHVLPLPRDPRARPYSLNSTFENIADTAIGKRIITAAEKRFASSPYPENAMKEFLQMPIRNIILGGVKERYALAIVNLANRQVAKAIFHVLFGRRS